MNTVLSELSAGIADTIAAAAPRVARVKAPGMGAVSSFVWRTDLVVTAEEALDGGEELTVTLADGSEREAELVGRDPSTDVALLKVATGDFEDWNAAPVPPVGAIALVVGRGETSPIAAYGLVAETGPAWQSMNGGRIDALVRLGLMLRWHVEGGAVISPEGALIGMAVTGPRRRSIVIPTATVARAVGALTSRGYVARGYLGVSVRPLDRRAGQKGVLVMTVEADSPAAKVGLVIGDVIATWNGTAITRLAEFARELGTESPGRDVKLGIMRGGAPVEVDVKIGERRLGQ